MKKAFTLMALTCVALGMNAQTITVSNIDQSLANDYAGGCEVDINNDGLKEIIVSGLPQWAAAPGRITEDADGNEVQSDLQSWILKWNGSSYDHAEFPYLVGLRSHIIPADFNGDGNMDLFLAGERFDYAGVYLGDGNGNFSKDPDFQWKDTEGNPIDTYGPRAVDVADFNQDGRPDFVTIGWDGINGERHDNCGVFINQGDGTFQNILEKGVIGNGEVNYEMLLCTIRAYDLNKDGYPDILLQGNVESTDPTVKAYTKDGKEVPRTFMVLLNAGPDDEGNVSFYSTEIATGVAHQYGNGTIQVADFNNDGTPDIFVTGESPDDVYPAGVWKYYSQLLLGKVTQGEDGNEVTYTDDNTSAAGHRDVRPLNATNIAARAIDYNADGYYDLFYDGWCEDQNLLNGTPNTQAGWLFSGTPSGLTTTTRIPGASEMGIFFLDNGITGALNYAFTGWHGDDNYFNDNTDIKTGRSMAFTVNPYPVASRPDAPTGLSQQVDGNNVTLSWTPAASSLKNVTYEYYIKDVTTGRFYNNVTSFVGGDRDGIRKVLRDGNAYMNTSASLHNLADGTYEWGVQTINAAQRGSAFAKGGTLIIGTGSGTGISNIPDHNATAVQQARYYNLNGLRISKPQQGVNIIRQSNGKVCKVLVK